MCLQPPVLILLRVLREGLSSIPCPMGTAVPSLFACPFPLKPCVSCPRWRSALHLQPCSPSLLSLNSNPAQVSVHPAATLITLGSVVLPTAQSSSTAGRCGAGDRHRELLWGGSGAGTETRDRATVESWRLEKSPEISTPYCCPIPTMPVHRTIGSLESEKISKVIELSHQPTITMPTQSWSSRLEESSEIPMSHPH